MNYADELRERGIQQRLLMTTHEKVYSEPVSYSEVSLALSGKRNGDKAARIRGTCSALIDGYDNWLHDFVANTVAEAIANEIIRKKKE